MAVYRLELTIPVANAAPTGMAGRLVMPPTVDEDGQRDDQ